MTRHKRATWLALLAGLSLGIAPNALEGAITDGLVVHLTFDGDLTDSSGRGANGYAVGNITYQSGVLGQAVHFLTKADGTEFDYVTLGYPLDLFFGSDATGDATDFSIGFWVKVMQQTDDPPFLSNKNWSSGDNYGWVIASEGDGLKWNLRDDGGSGRRDSPHVAPQVEDGQWHQVVVTFVRRGAATIYVDGTAVDSTSIAPDSGKPVGSLDSTSTGFNIGQDGTGTYTDGGSASIEMLMDDLGIWRRALTAAEVASIYHAGLDGKTLSEVPAAANPYLSDNTPGNVANNVPANSKISAVITDGSTALAPDSVQLSVNGQSVQPTSNKVGLNTTLTYQPASFLPAGANQVTLVFGNNATPQMLFTNQWSFTVAPYTVLDAGSATPEGSANTRGMIYRVAQARSDAGLPDSVARADAQVKGTLIDPSTGSPYVNHAVAGPNSNGSYSIDAVNFNITGSDGGTIPGDTYFPGIPGDEGSSENFAVEVVTYLDLKAGYYRFGVNSDDGFQVRSALDIRDSTASILGEYDGGRGAADSMFDVAVPQDGIYAVRLLYEQGGGDGSVEFFSEDLTTGARALINDPNNANAIPAYRVRTGVPDLPYVTSFAPATSQNVSPDVTFSATIQDTANQVDPSTVKLLLDGTVLGANVQKTGTVTSVNFKPAALLPSESSHTLTLSFDTTGTPPLGKTNNFHFQVVKWKNIQLPAPIYLETFDEVQEGQLPAGWTVTNYTDSLTSGDDLSNPLSDSFKNWVVISRQRVIDIGNAGGWDSTIRLDVAPGQVVNGVTVTNLVNGNFCYAESDQRGGNQVQYLFSPEYDLTGHSNIWVSYHSIYEQNQDDIAAVEYSIDSGKTWLPIVYMLDGPDIVYGANGQPNGYATMIAPQSDTAVYTDPATGEQKGGYYGAFIGVATNQWPNIGPYISARVNDDPIESKRVELFRLDQADNQPKVSFRFAQAGTASWYFGIDDFGLYSIAPQPTQLGPLAIKLTGTTAEITWPGAGTLQSADQVIGPWTDVSGAASPYPSPLTGSAKFYRLRQ